MNSFLGTRNWLEVSLCKRLDIQVLKSMRMIREEGGKAELQDW